MRPHVSFNNRLLATAMALFCSFSVIAGTDGDGVPDASDNCINDANGGQLDTDGDAFGNACDTDLNNDGFTNFPDLAAFKSVFLTPDLDADFNATAFVDLTDLAIFNTQFLQTPGPSAFYPGFIGTGSPPTVGDASGNVSLLPATQNVALGDSVVFDLEVDFMDNPTLGGAIDIFFDPSILSFASFDFQPIFASSPYSRIPDLGIGELTGLSFGDFGGLSSALIGTLTFDSIAAGAVSLSMVESFIGGGFYAAEDPFGAQEPVLIGANVKIIVEDSVPVPATLALISLGLAGLGFQRRGTLAG